MNTHFIERGLMNTAGRKRGLTGRSRDTLHKAKGTILIEAQVHSDQMVLVIVRQEAGPVAGGQRR